MPEPKDLRPEPGRCGPERLPQAASSQGGAAPAWSVADEGRRQVVGMLGTLGSTGAAALALPAGAQPPVVPAADPALAPGLDAVTGQVLRGRRLKFPRDHGAHTGTRVEWWYLTGQLAPEGQAAPSHGFQVTFFRFATGLWPVSPASPPETGGRFAPRHLLFAHAAVTDLAAGRHVHDQRLQRWNGVDETPGGHASRTDTALVLGRWLLRRDAATGRYHTRIHSLGAGLTLDLLLTPTQPLLLQGDEGFSRKGPLEHQASHYYSLPHLAARGTVGGQALAGRAWLDHEWSNALMPPDAVGWDWAGLHLADGGSLTLFRLRRADGSAVWAGGSWRPAGGAVQTFAATQVQWQVGRLWTSPHTGARYPVDWTLHTPLGRLRLRALLDSQELDSRASTGTVYWEGLSELLDTSGRQIGVGYLEMTGYSGKLRV